MASFRGAAPPRPIATLRHHSAALSTVAFTRIQGSGPAALLLSGDVDGNVVS